MKTQLKPKLGLKQKQPASQPARPRQKPAPNPRRCRPGYKTVTAAVGTHLDPCIWPVARPQPARTPQTGSLFHESRCPAVAIKVAPVGSRAPDRRVASTRTRLGTVCHTPARHTRAHTRSHLCVRFGGAPTCPVVQMRDHTLRTAPHAGSGPVGRATHDGSPAHPGRRSGTNTSGRHMLGLHGMPRVAPQQRLNKNWPHTPARNTEGRARAHGLPHACLAERATQTAARTTATGTPNSGRGVPRGDPTLLASGRAARHTHAPRTGTRCAACVDSTLGPPSTTRRQIGCGNPHPVPAPATSEWNRKSVGFETD